MSAPYVATHGPLEGRGGYYLMCPCAECRARHAANEERLNRELGALCPHGYRTSYDGHSCQGYHAFQNANAWAPCVTCGEPLGDRAHA